MPYRKEQIKHSAVIAIIGIILWLLLDQIYTALNFGGDYVPGNLSISLSIFLGVFLVLSIIGKIKKPSFSLILPVFLIYFPILSAIIFTVYIFPYSSATIFPFYTPHEIFLQWLEHGVPYIATFSLLGITAGIMMVRLTSKLKYDAFYFIFASFTGVGVGTFLIKLFWDLRYTILPSSPLYPYLSIFILIETLVGIIMIIIQIAWLRKRQPSNIHTCTSIAFWIIAFITTIFLYEWLIYVHPP